MSERIYDLAGALLAACPDISVQRALKLALLIIEKLQWTWEQHEKTH